MAKPLAHVWTDARLLGAGCCGVLSRELTVVLLIMPPQGRAAARLFLISVISHTQLIKPVAPHPTPTTPAATTTAPAATTLTAVNMLVKIRNRH